MKIEINNLTGHPILSRAVDKKIFSTVAKIVLKGENRKTETLSLAFVSKSEIKKLNKKFRKKNKATDVLSFELDVPFGFAQGKNKFLGEIIICPEVVRDNAKKYNISVKQEMTKMLIHGILHLCGYDHEKSKKDEKIMEEKQEKYLAEINPVK
ncbi:MAG: rRNA maturation RNase YbeY [Candidatus Staskawiczbacteria bacterium]|jgi:probable rRNA maturation factor